MLKFRDMRKGLLILFILLCTTASAQIEFSTAGFFSLEGSGRKVESMNPIWKFHKGDVKGAENVEFNDSAWSVVSLPNGMEFLPVDASGGINYRGAAWYRKEFTLGADTYEGKRLVLYFEAIMGRSKVWVNGTEMAHHYGGFLPIGIDITDNIKLGEKNVISVMTDNSDDPIYPPGKPQATLDFCYFGGIYRDCWLISTGKTYITDANMVDKVADGGLMVHYTNVTDKSATINLKVNLQNDGLSAARGSVEFELEDGVKKSIKYSLPKGENRSFSTAIAVANPKLWSPDSPYLYDMKVVVKNEKGKIVDGYRKKIGVRTIEFSHNKGFILNGKEYPRKLIGANRHQDFAIVGNALSNNLHWRDVEKLKDAGMDIVRNAHYPQDPAFMDACDALGMFVIVNTPGWQFWNKEPIFEQRVYSDIRAMVRRDRNSPTVIMWEPILNETWYPEAFAENVHNIIKEEFPFSPNYTACDDVARGNEFFDIIFAHPSNSQNAFSAKKIDTNKVYFTREFGDNVDNWNSHNSNSRVARQWGEVPMLIQAQHYAAPSYVFTSLDMLHSTPRYHIGGTLWHSFDHQRGYHPDPFYGGIMTAFRRPKYSHYMFQSQDINREPMVYIANEMTPFSPKDVTVYSNCDEVRLHTNVGDTLRIYRRKRVDPLGGEGMISPIITFENAFDVMTDKALSRGGKTAESYLLAEGYNDGKLVASFKRMPARRPSKIEILIDTLSAAPVASGGDLLVVVARITDDKGNVKRLNNEWIHFEVEGEARIVGNSEIHCNPTPVLWGEAPIILQTTTTPGKVVIRASIQFQGDHTPVGSSVEFTTLAPTERLIYDTTVKQVSNSGVKIGSNKSNREEIEAKLREVERQQDDFGEKNR